eukprot:SAG22_NODE_611_length_8586_cov_8.288795_9_plen_147_part_00
MITALKSITEQPHRDAATAWLLMRALEIVDMGSEDAAAAEQKSGAKRKKGKKKPAAKSKQQSQSHQAKGVQLGGRMWAQLSAPYLAAARDVGAAAAAAMEPWEIVRPEGGLLAVGLQVHATLSRDYNCAAFAELLPQAFALCMAAA